jgi:PhnB protein
MENRSVFEASIVPTLSVRNGAAAIEFYKRAFDAIEIMVMADPDGAVVAELSIGGAHFLLADESPEHDNYSPESISGSTVRLGLLVADPDALALQAVQAGATEIYPVADQDYGYRLGRVKDPFGHHWEIYRPLH